MESITFDQKRSPLDKTYSPLKQIKVSHQIFLYFLIGKFILGGANLGFPNLLQINLDEAGGEDKFKEELKRIKGDKNYRKLLETVKGKFEAVIWCACVNISSDLKSRTLVNAF